LEGHEKKSTNQPDRVEPAKRVEFLVTCLE